MPTLLYSVDLSAQANQTCTANGAYMIDGKTWYAKGSLSQGGATYTRNLVNGSGLSIKHTAAVVGTVLGTNGDLDYPHWFLPFSQVPGYDASAPMLVRARFKYDALGVVYAFLGVCDTTNDGTGLRAAVRSKDHFVAPTNSATTSAGLACKLGTGAVVNGTVENRAGAIANNQCVVGLQTRLLETTTMELRGAEFKATGLPVLASSFLPALPPTDPFYDPGARSNPGVFFGVQNQTGALWGAYLEMLEFWRLTVVPADPTPPTIANVSPVAGSTIARTTALQFRLTDNLGAWALKELWVGFGASPDAYECAHDGTSFGGRYIAGSTRSVVTNGWDFSLVRTNGWPAGFQVRLRASVVDAAGNVVVINA